MTSQSEDTPKRSPKKPYEAPRLEEYGSVVELTAGSSAGTSDDGVSNMTMVMTGGGP